MSAKLSFDQFQLLARLKASGAIQHALYKRAESGGEEFSNISFENEMISGAAMRTVVSNIAKPTSLEDMFILAAFKAAGLDYNNPFDWKVV